MLKCESPASHCRGGLLSAHAQTLCGRGTAPIVVQSLSRIARAAQGYSALSCWRMQVSDLVASRYVMPGDAAAFGRCYQPDRAKRLEVAAQILYYLNRSPKPEEYDLGEVAREAQGKGRI